MLFYYANLVSSITNSLKVLEALLKTEIDSNKEVKIIGKKILFDNCPLDIKNEFYAKLDSLGTDTVIRESGRVTDDENSFIVQYEAVKILNELGKDIKKDDKEKPNKTF